MRALAIKLVALFALVALGSPGAHSADVGGGCGGAWHGAAPKACTFNFRGFPILMSADARVSSGTATAHVWITIEGFDGTVLHECRKSAPGYVNTAANNQPGDPCEGVLNRGQIIDERWATFHLRCHVDGVASSAFTNSYYCKSAHGF